MRERSFCFYIGELPGQSQRPLVAHRNGLGDRFVAKAERQALVVAAVTALAHDDHERAMLIRRTARLITTDESKIPN